MLHEAAGVIRRRSLVFVVSDFISQPGWARLRWRACHSRHDVVAVRLWDPLEMALPEGPGLGLVTVEDAETGEQVLVDASRPGLPRTLRRIGTHEAGRSGAAARR